MFCNFKDQIVKGTKTGTEYSYRRYSFQKEPNIVPLVLFWKNLCLYRRYFKSTECPPLDVVYLVISISVHYYY